MEKYWRKVAFTAFFGIFFGLLEAIVVVYLRQLFGSENTLLSPRVTPDDVAWTLGFIAFLKPSASIIITQSQRLLSLELWRELSTLVMLVALGLIAGKTTREKLAYFLLAFGVWDIFYYIFLRIITGWPSNLIDLDVYFLIPFAWVGPVATPIVVSFIMVLVAIVLLSQKLKKHEL